MMRRLALLLVLLAGPRLLPSAVVNSLDASISAAPAAVDVDGLVTVLLSVTNTGSTTANNVTASAYVDSGTGSVVKVSGPMPAIVPLLPGGSVSFTWTFSALACGSVRFAAVASGQDGGANTVSSGVRLSSAVGICATPTPTPTLSPTPWVVYATPVPPGGWARARGNLLRVSQGGSIQLEAALPEPLHISIDIYDRLGRSVRHMELDAAAGLLQTAWDGRGDDGLLVATGIYAAHFKGRGFSHTVKLAVLR